MARGSSASACRRTAREGRQAPRGRAITTSEEYLIGYLDGPSGTGNASGANHFQSQSSKRHIGGIKRMPTKNGPGTGLGERFRGAGSGSHSTLRWREMDSNFRFLVARPSNRHGRSDCFLETWSGSVGEPEIRIHLPPARSPLRTGSKKSGAGAADPWGAHRGGVDPTRNRKFESISLQRLCAKMAHSQSKHTILSQTSASLAQLCFDLTERHNTREALSRSRLRRWPHESPITEHHQQRVSILRASAT